MFSVLITVNLFLQGVMRDQAHLITCHEGTKAE